MPLGHPGATTITLRSIGGVDLVFRSRLKVTDVAAEGAVFMHCTPPSGYGNEVCTRLLL